MRLPLPGRRDDGSAVDVVGTAGWIFMNRRIFTNRQGITLIEMLVAMSIISLMLAIVFPSLTTGLDGIRLRTSVDDVAAFFNTARNQADRRQSPVQLSILPEQRSLEAASVDGAWRDRLTLPSRIEIVLPKQITRFMLYPAAPSPAFRMVMGSQQGSRAGLEINILTGVPRVWSGNEE